MASFEARIRRLERRLKAPPPNRAVFEDAIERATSRTRYRFINSTPADTSPEAMRDERIISTYLESIGVQDLHQPGRERAKLLAFAE